MRFGEQFPQSADVIVLPGRLSQIHIGGIEQALPAPRFLVGTFPLLPLAFGVEVGTIGLAIGFDAEERGCDAAGQQRHGEEQTKRRHDGVAATPESQSLPGTGAIDGDRLMGQRPLDVSGQGFRVVVTLVPLPGHRGGTDRIEFPRDRGIDVTRSRRRGFADAMEEVGDGESGGVGSDAASIGYGGAMRSLARQDFEEDGAQAVDVGAVVEQVHSAGGLFGGHVRGRAGCRSLTSGM